jgi:long-subunit acyl-CoA synthetase (AMP-forming)
MFFFGAAPLKQTTIDYFASLDFPLLNAYGLSETTGAASA